MNSTVERWMAQLSWQPKAPKWGYFSKSYFIIPGDGEQWKCRLIFLKEFPSNLGHAVGLVPFLKNRESGSGTKGGLGMGNKLDCFCQWVKVSMVSWFWKDGCLWLPIFFAGGKEMWSRMSVVSSQTCFLGSRTHFGEGNGNPLQYSCLENPMDGGAW